VKSCAPLPPVYHLKCGENLNRRDEIVTMSDILVIIFGIA
jgi:hypothetical protein